MRIVATIAILILAGIVATAILTVSDRTLSPSELKNVRTVCPECHGEVPEYDHASKVHNKHAAFECSFCHGDIGPLKTTDSIHNTLKWLCIGTLSLVLIGIMMSFAVSNKINGTD